MLDYYQRGKERCCITKIQRVRKYIIFNVQQESFLSAATQQGILKKRYLVNEAAHAKLQIILIKQEQEELFQEIF